MSHHEAVELAKLMVSRKMRSEGVTPYEGFWNNHPWKRLFKEQVIAATALLKVYSYIAITNVFKRKDCQWQYSLRHKATHELFHIEQKKLDKMQEDANKSTEIQTTSSTEVKEKYGGKTNPLRNL